MIEHNSFRIPYGLMRRPLYWARVPDSFGFSQIFGTPEGPKITAYHPNGGVSECWVRYDVRRAKYFAYDVHCGGCLKDVEIPAQYFPRSDP